MAMDTHASLSKIYPLARMLLCASAVVYATAHSEPIVATNKTEGNTCVATLKTIKRNDPVFERLDKVYRQSLRFGGTAHRIVPHWHATYQDIVDAKNKLTAKDVPYMVWDLAQVEEPNVKQRVAVGVLGLFGDQTLACIEAALETPGIKGRFTLAQIKIGIAADRATNSR